jgi:hypothetical protein
MLGIFIDSSPTNGVDRSPRAARAAFALDAAQGAQDTEQQAIARGRLSHLPSLP